MAYQVAASQQRAYGDLIFFFSPFAEWTMALNRFVTLTSVGASDSHLRYYF